MPMSGTGSKRPLLRPCSGTPAPRQRAAPACRHPAPPAHGFTLIEMMVAITIVALVLAVSVPASSRLYRNIQYRESVRDTVTLFATARYEAVRSGQARDVRIDPRTNELRLEGEVRHLPDEVNLVVHAAQELGDRGVGVIRFYPEGGSSGGGVDLQIPGRYGVRVNVDWLLGRVSQEKYGLD